MAINLTEEEIKRKKREEEERLARERFLTSQGALSPVAPGALESTAPNAQPKNPAPKDPTPPTPEEAPNASPTKPKKKEEPKSVPSFSPPSFLLPQNTKKEPQEGEEKAPKGTSRISPPSFLIPENTNIGEIVEKANEPKVRGPLDQMWEGGKQILGGFAGMGTMSPEAMERMEKTMRGKGASEEEIEDALTTATAGDGKALQGAKDVLVGTAKVATPVFRAVTGLFDPDVAMTKELIESEKTGQAIKEGEKAFREQQLYLMGHEVLDLKDRGVTKTDAFATLEGMKDKIPQVHYETLKERLAQQYAAPSEGPVTNPELEEIKQRQDNRRKGKGDSDGYVAPEVTKTDEQQAMEFAATQVGQNAAFGFNTPPVWYESDAFSRSLVTFGLGILSGQDYATAFAASSKVFDTNFEKEKRRAYANELTAQGYSKQQIMEWVEKGDASVLEHKETFHTDWDDYGYFQQSSTTGKKTYLTSREELLTSKEDRKYKRLQTAQKLKEITGGEDGDDITKGSKPRNLMAVMFSLGYNEELADLAENDDNLSGLVKNAIAHTIGGDYGQMFTSMGGAGEDARLWENVQTQRRQFIEFPLRLVTGAVIAKGEEGSWTRSLFVMNKGERTDGPNGGYEGSTAQRKKRLRSLLATQANAIYKGDKAYSVPTAHVQMLIEGKATPIRDPQTNIIRGVEYPDGTYDLYEPMSKEEQEKRIRLFETQTSTLSEERK